MFAPATEDAASAAAGVAAVGAGAGAGGGVAGAAAGGGAATGSSFLLQPANETAAIIETTSNVFLILFS